MEEIAMQSGMLESRGYGKFFVVQSRISISIIFLANVISVLIAIGLSRVLIQQGANFFKTYLYSIYFCSFS